MKKVSIIMPCYNDGKYIQEAIDSALSQTYKNIELIIVDDGSDDQTTINIFSKLKDIDNPMLKILQTSHVGPSAARNFGISNCTGEYILPLDADDKIDPTYVEKAVKILDENENVGIVYCESEFFGEKTGKWELPEYSIESMLVDNVIFVTALFRKEDWETVGGFSETMKLGLEDYDFWLSLIELGREVHQIHEVLFYYRKKNVSRSTGVIFDKELTKQTYKDIYDKHQKLYEQYKDIYPTLLRNAYIDVVSTQNKYGYYFDKLVRLRNLILRRK